MEYKPLKELANDDQAVVKVFGHLCHGPILDYKASGEKLSVYGSSSTGDRVDLHIWHDGDVFLEWAGKDIGISNPFALVDLIRSLGYSA